MSALNFNATDIAPQTDFAPIPDGDYIAMIVDSAMKSTKTGRGQYLEITLQIIDGPMTNRLLWDRLILIHDNAKTVEIAQRQLSAICHAVGVLQVQDSAQLHNLPLVVRVKYIEDQQYGPKNEIGAYKPAPGKGVAPAPAQAAAQAQTPVWTRPQTPAQAPTAPPPTRAQAPTAPPPTRVQASAPAASAPPWAR